LFHLWSKTKFKVFILQCCWRWIMNDLWKKTIWSKISWCIWQALHISNPYSSKTNQQQQLRSSNGEDERQKECFCFIALQNKLCLLSSTTIEKVVLLSSKGRFVVLDIWLKCDKFESAVFNSKEEKPFWVFSGIVQTGKIVVRKKHT
jgi:hypothetical protein